MLRPDSSSTTGLLQELPLAMALSTTKYTIGSATEHSDAIIYASGLATEHSEEGKPPRIPIIEVASGEGIWWSIPQQLSAALYANCEAGQDAVYRMNHGGTTINRYMIDFVHKQQRDIKNGHLRAIRLIWILEEDATPQWTGQIPSQRCAAMSAL